MREFHRQKLIKQKQQPEFRLAHIEGMIRSPNFHKSTPAKQAAMAKALLVSNEKEARSKAVATMKERGHSARIGKENAERIAKQWLLVSPQNVIHRFKNLSQFIRDNPSLFNPEDIIWHKYSCRAVHAISKLRPSRKKPEASWKGWRWLSIEERLKDWCGLNLP